MGLAERYGRPDAPLGGYAVLAGTFSACLAGLGWIARRRRTPSLGELALVAVATHKIARLAATDRVTSSLRAPFARRICVVGNECKDEARGTGLQRAIGELVTCPFCLGPWIATALTAGMIVAPRAARTIAGVFVAVAATDALNALHARRRDASPSVSDGPSLARDRTFAADAPLSNVSTAVGALPRSTSASSVATTTKGFSSRCPLAADGRHACDACVDHDDEVSRAVPRRACRAGPRETIAALKKGP